MIQLPRVAWKLLACKNGASPDCIIVVVSDIQEMCIRPTEHYLARSGESVPFDCICQRSSRSAFQFSDIQLPGSQA